MPAKTLNGEHSGALAAKYLDLERVRKLTAEQVLEAILAAPISQRSRQVVASVMWWDLMDYIHGLTQTLHGLIVEYWSEEEERQKNGGPEEPIDLEEVKDALLALGYYRRTINRRVRIRWAYYRPEKARK